VRDGRYRSGEFLVGTARTRQVAVDRWVGMCEAVPLHVRGAGAPI